MPRDSLTVYFLFGSLWAVSPVNAAREICLEVNNLKGMQQALTALNTRVALFAAGHPMPEDRNPGALSGALVDMFRRTVYFFDESRITV